VVEECEPGSALGLPGGYFFFPGGFEAKDLVEGVHATGSGFGEAVEEEDEPVGNGVFLPYAGQTLIVFFTVTLQEIGEIENGLFEYALRNSENMSSRPSWRSARLRALSTRGS